MSFADFFRQHFFATALPKVKPLPVQAMPTNNRTVNTQGIYWDKRNTQDAWRNNEAAWSRYFAQYSAQYGIPWGVLRGVCATESGMGTHPESWKYRGPRVANGIMQIIPAVHPDAGNIMDPETAIRYAAKYLKECYKVTGSWKGAIVGYNAGPYGTAALMKKYGSNWYAHRDELRKKYGADANYYAKVSQGAGYGYA